MSEFSPSGIYGLPATTAESLARMDKGGGDPRVLGWCIEAVQEGDRINRADPTYDRIEVGQNYVGGVHGRLQTPGEPASPGWLPKIILNQCRKAMQAHVSALTDLKPTFGYKATNPLFEFQQHLLNKLLIAWWMGQLSDIELGNVIKYAFAGGTGDCEIAWDATLPDGGNQVLKARDCRDTLPVRPSHHHDLQLWQGMTLRDEHTVNALRSMYPQYADRFRPSSDSVLSSIAGRFRTAVARIISPASDTLSGLSQPTHSGKPRSGHMVLYRTFIADQTKNMTGKPVAMGDPTSAWAYVVPPREYLYPNKRLVVWAENLILYDGPSPFWHGMYPLSRLMLWSLPWQALGVPILDDLTPLQDGINETLQDVRLGIRQWLHRSVRYDRLAVSESTMRMFDSRKPGARIKMNQGLEGGLTYEEGPNPQVLALGVEFLDKLIARFESLAGTANLEQLMQLRQMPSADTIQKYFEALTPEIRYEGRMLEAFLRPLAEMWKTNTFQFMTASRRIAILGDAGLALQDFDYDPGVLVPAMSKMKIEEPPAPMGGMLGSAPGGGPMGGDPMADGGDPAGAPGGAMLPPPEPPKLVPDPQYIPELDESLPIHQRAKFFHKLFVFNVAPNSLLAMHTQEQKMMRFQLARMGYYDFWSLHETLETPNIGTPPAIPLPPLQPPSPEEIQQAMLQAGMNALGMPPLPGQTPSKFIIDPASGQLLELRVPMTVTERLMAQQMLGIGMTENPAGRKASGQDAPQQETKSDGAGGQRSTITESSK